MENRKTNNTIQKHGGTVLILVVVVTLLLSVIGILFLMVSRVGDVMGTAAEQEHELDQAVQAVADRIEQILMEDLFGSNLDAPGIADGSGGSNEPYDAPGTADPWLASLEPTWVDDNGTPDDPTDDLYRWEHITNVWGLPETNFANMAASHWDRDRTLQNPSLVMMEDYPPASAVQNGAPADADGDGVADSVWVRIDRPWDLHGDGGQPDPEWLFPRPGDRPIYAAVRIIDNCGMLNLNTANMTRIAFPNVVGDGKYLSQVDYQAFLRGQDIDNPIVIKEARRLNHREMYDTFEQYHNNVIMNIENPNDRLGFLKYILFDLGDELEIRNRFFLTSLVQARFEQKYDPARSQFGCYETFDFGRGSFPGEKYSDPDDPGWNTELRVKRIPYEDKTENGIHDLARWKMRMNPANFDDSDPANLYGYYYDRRHVCTFYSFDRNLRRGGDPYLGDLSSDREREVYKKFFMPAEGQAVSVRDPLIPEADADPAVAAQNQYASRRHILHLLYAFRAYYLDKGESLRSAARKAAQIAANMIDYLDDHTDSTAQTGPFSTALYGSQYDARPTYIDRRIVNRMIAETSANLYAHDRSVPVFTEVTIPAAFEFGLETGDVVFGFERQPFITELYTRIDGNTGRVAAVALELQNPYDSAIALDHWQVVFSGSTRSTVFDIPADEELPAVAAGRSSRVVLEIHSSATAPIPAASTLDISGSYSDAQITAMLTDPNCTIDLQRPDPRDPNPQSPTMFVTVDQIRHDQLTDMLIDAARRQGLTDGRPTHHSLQRGDTAWAFTNAGAVRYKYSVAPDPNPARLGMANDITGVTASGYQMPVDVITLFASGRRFCTLGDFQKVLFVGNQAGTDPNTVTWAAAAAKEEGDIRFDIVKDPDLLGYICFLNRQEGSLPGRININTAAVHVMAAAIPGNLVEINTATPAPTTGGDPRAYHWAAYDYAELIPAGRPFAHLGDLVDKVPAFQTYVGTGSLDVGAAGITDDLEERDWILSPLSNIFTTRSDVFTAYILVRFGPNGPQRRVMAIFDRSQVWSPQDRPRLLALKTVPNPR